MFLTFGVLYEDMLSPEHAGVQTGTSRGVFRPESGTAGGTAALMVTIASWAAPNHHAVNRVSADVKSPRGAQLCARLFYLGYYCWCVGPVDMRKGLLGRIEVSSCTFLTLQHNTRFPRDTYLLERQFYSERKGGGDPLACTKVLVLRPLLPLSCCPVTNTIILYNTRFPGATGVMSDAKPSGTRFTGVPVASDAA